MFDETGWQHGSIGFKDNREVFIRPINPLGVHLREGIENIILKNLDDRDKGIRGGINKRNMPKIIPSEAFSVSLREDLILRDR